MLVGDLERGPEEKLTRARCRDDRRVYAIALRRSRGRTRLSREVVGRRESSRCEKEKGGDPRLENFRQTGGPRNLTSSRQLLARTAITHRGDRCSRAGWCCTKAEENTLLAKIGSFTADPEGKLCTISRVPSAATPASERSRSHPLSHS